MIITFKHVSLPKNKLTIRQLESGSVGVNVESHDEWIGVTNETEFFIDSADQLDAIIKVLQVAREKLR